ncbi:C40 family peptidase [Streptomyces sp. AK04-3B]|uniref:C40 family peptidase n=1 Tax=Streptomyces sp. AK04-3B TaxID=3028650 RepID=UPI0029A781A6|nr:C40 family peptidase [Streptomyces sp. AK04-3B]MDX3804517.1 C40 family peptidase [Streptomyces sp. AK04-3B]
MASQHGRPRSAGSRVAGIRPPVLATAALTSVALLSQSANAAPSADGRPSLEEVEKKVGDLYRQAESATEQNNSAKEKTTKQRTRGDGFLGVVAPQRTRKPDEAREEPGSQAGAQYRTGVSAPDTAAFPLPDAPQDHVGRNRLTDLPTDGRQSAVDDYAAAQSAAPKTRQEAAGSNVTRVDPQHGLRIAKAAVQKKLGDARELLSRLTAQEQARLAAVEQRKHEETARAAAEFALQQAAARQAAEQAAEQATARQQSGGESSRVGPSGTGQVGAGPSGTGQVGAGPSGTGPSGTGPSGTGPVGMAPVGAASLAAPSPTAASPAAATSAAASPTAASSPGTASSPGSVADASYAIKAEKALAFARAQIGKPYVWGATGPGSYDCSGLAQAAWKAAGVTLPRSTRDQADAGVTVPLADARPGDLVFFYDDVSHVGVYIGNGMMIHSPKPGAYVREESVYCDGESGIHGVVRPA